MWLLPVTFPIVMAFGGVLGVRGVPLPGVESYAYAKSQQVNYLGKTEQPKSPLDFLTVTDHAQYLGALPMTADQNSPLSKRVCHTAALA